MELSKKIPARTKTIKFLWCRQFQEAGQLNEARAVMGMKTFDKCYWCGHKFEEDEMTFLASQEYGANRVLCGDCADELAESQAKEE